MSTIKITYVSNSLTVSAVKVGWEKKPLAHPDALAGATSLDMTRHWQRTARSYFGRITKEHIIMVFKKPPDRRRRSG
jgi:ParB family transcriptional regulator, chromosome partitioning protein